MVEQQQAATGGGVLLVTPLVSSLACRDSSDEETVTLWIRAVQVLRKMPEEGRQEQRQLLRHRILQAMKGRGHSRRLPADLAKKMLAQLEEEESNSEDTTSSSSSEASGPGSSSR